MNSFKIGSLIDQTFKTEINEIHIKGQIIFSNSLYNFKYSSLSNQIVCNIYGRHLIYNDFNKYVKLNDAINLKWGDENEKYNSKILIIDNDHKYTVVALIYRKNNKNLFCCLSYTSNNLVDINNKCFSNWFYPVGNTIRKFLNLNLEKNNRIQLNYLYKNYNNINLKTLALTESENLMIFDIETENFCDKFIEYQKNKDERLKLYYPSIRVICCIYIIDDEVHEKSYTTNNIKDFLKLLRQFNKIISFNGLHFDFPVIQKQVGYKSPLKYNGTHFDVHQKIYQITGKRFSLDSIVRLNLNEKKMVKGRDMKSLNLEELIKACFSDVRHTYLIYRLLKSKSLLLPGVLKNNEEFAENYSQLPITKTDYCNYCQNSKIVKIENLRYESEEDEVNYTLVACLNCLELRTLFN